MGGGYGTPPSAGYWAWECVPDSVTTCYPAQPEIPAVPATPPTPDIIIRDLHIGWNAHSRTIDPLGLGEYLQFTFGTGSRGIVGLGLRYLEGGLPEQHLHGLVIDVNGIKVYESGVVVQTIETVQVVDTIIRIYRQDEDNSVVYHVQNAAGGSTAVKSTVPLSSRLAQMYVFTWLYTGGDVVPEYDYLEGEVQFAEA